MSQTERLFNWPCPIASTSDSYPGCWDAQAHTDSSSVTPLIGSVWSMCILLSPPRSAGTTCLPKNCLIHLERGRVLDGLLSLVFLPRALSYPPPCVGFLSLTLPTTHLRHLLQESHQLNPVEEPLWLRSACSNQDTPVLPMTKKVENPRRPHALKHSTNSGTHACFLQRNPRCPDLIHETYL